MKCRSTLSWKPTSLSASSTCERDKVQGTSVRRAPSSGKLGCAFPELSKGIYVIYAQSRTPQEIWITRLAEGSNLCGQTWEKFNLQRKKKMPGQGVLQTAGFPRTAFPGLTWSPFQLTQVSPGACSDRGTPWLWRYLCPRALLLAGPTAHCPGGQRKLRPRKAERSPEVAQRPREADPSPSS